MEPTVPIGRFVPLPSRRRHQEESDRDRKGRVFTLVTTISKPCYIGMRPLVYCIQWVKGFFVEMTLMDVLERGGDVKECLRINFKCLRESSEQMFGLVGF